MCKSWQIILFVHTYILSKCVSHFVTMLIGKRSPQMNKAQKRYRSLGAEIMFTTFTNEGPDVLSLQVWNRWIVLREFVNKFRSISQVWLSHVCDSYPSRYGGPITNADFLCQAVESTRGDHTLHPEYSLRPTAASFHPGTYTPISACDAYSCSRVIYNCSLFLSATFFSE